MFLELPHGSRCPALRSLIIATVVSLGVAAAAAAEPFTVNIVIDEQYGDLLFVPAPGEHAYVPAGSWLIAGGWTRFGDGDPLDIIGGEVTLTSGPFVSYHEGAPGVDATTVFDGSGRFEIDFIVALPDGQPHAGTFTGLLGPMTIVEDSPGFSGLVFTELLVGDFDPVTAAQFHMSRHVQATPFTIWTDGNVSQGDPLHLNRTFGDWYFDAQVPEPSALVLFGLASAAALRRRRTTLRASR